MKSIVWTLAFAVPLTFLTVAAHAADRRAQAALKKMDPESRLTQVCDLEAMNRIARDHSPYRPDRAMVDSLAEPQRNGHSLRGKGGAFRSGGEWYRFSFTCEATSDHMSVTSFDYKIGNKVDRKEWTTLGLF